MKANKKLRLILLVDDDLDDNYFHTLVIKEVDAAEEIISCTDGEDALHFLQQKGKYALEDQAYPQPELIFLDINMPRMDGWTFLEEYNKLASHFKGGPVIIMLTTSPHPEDRRRAEAYNLLDQFITKPLTEAHLIDILDKHFQE